MPEKRPTVEVGLLRPEEELRAHILVNRLRDANDDLVGDEVRINAPYNRLETPQITMSSSGGSGFWISAIVAEDALSSVDRPGPCLVR